MSTAFAALTGNDAPPQGSAPAIARNRCSVKTLPAGALFSVDTADFGEFCDFAVGWNLDHQLIGRQKARIGVSGFITPSLQLAFVQQTGDCCWQGTSPSGSVTLQVSLGGSAGTTHCGRSIEPLQMAISRSSEPFELLAQSGASHLVASFSQAKVEQYAADVWHEPRLLRDPSGRLQFPGMTHRQRYVDACQQAIRDVQKEPKLLSDSRCASVLQEKLLENLVLQGCANALYPSDRSRYKVARRAYRYLLESLEDVPSIQQLCTVTAANYKTLQRGYRETYGMSPQAHIKALRLSRAQRDLRQPAASTTVTSVAVRWGFLELGRFAVQYRERFGESPSETLRKARGASGRLSATATP